MGAPSVVGRDRENRRVGLLQVRATAARAMGALVGGMGEECFPELIPWMLEMLRADTTNVERAGAALGLAEVLAVLGPARVDVMLPDIIAGSASPSVSVRDGNLMLLRYLPATLGDSYQNQVCECECPKRGTHVRRRKAHVHVSSSSRSVTSLALPKKLSRVRTPHRTSL